MAYLNRMAKFLSQALEWKARFPNAQFYAGLRYEPFIYQKARKIFPNYHKLYPDDKDFTQRFVRDLRNKDTTLLKIINPDQLGPDLETASIQFETEARLEQQVVAQTNPQEVSQPFSLSSPPVPRIPLSPRLSTTTEEEKSTMVSQAEQHQTPPPVSKPRFQLPKIPSGISSFGQNLGSSTQIGLKKGLGRVGSGLGSIFGGLARGGGGVLVKAGGFGADAMVRASNQISRGGLITGPSKRVWVGAVLGFLILFFILGSISGLPTSTPTGEAAPIPGNVGIAVSSPSDISSCEFIHQNRIYKVGSSKLRSLIAEVAAKSGVPASVLAAIAFQETANFTFQPNDSHPAFPQDSFPEAGCGSYFPTSETGALGLMQVQPPANISTYGAKYNPNAADLEGIRIGLSFLGRDLTSLAKNDFCNVRTSLYLGAGVMISKNSGKAPTTADEVRSVACKYHGSCATAAFSYADEVKQGFESCKAAPAPVVAPASMCPIPNGKVLCGSQFTPVNGCGHCGVGYGPIQHCGFEGTKYAIDIVGQPSQQIILPQVNGSMIQWTWMKQQADSSQAIQAYAGTEPISGKKYYLQLHHTQPGSGNTKGGISGEVGGTICARGCDHVHVQIGDGGDSQTNTRWLDSAQHFCRQ